ncbi:hypothetical protein DMB42_24515 [Nonomuraea sp. WAC 01424]|uniref:nucleoside deaminase n=1 Tax=Nonomuraea sp. WAC 01424 TaxID=2203200 RepID=UPI000F777F78|nr:nucleoside deaminase [Nonomuraea sp. WAC 01424]RSN06461.1 hypothetical protein DMB42_24515 [Nonomuraea sp. WAC 01424]
MDFVQRTIDIALQNVAEGGRPFATVIVKDGEIVAESPNMVAQTGDPTAHAEILAIREACTKLGTEHLTDATIYVLAHPCPMRHEPREDAVEVYRFWQERNGGERRVAGAPISA